MVTLRRECHPSLSAYRRAYLHTDRSHLHRLSGTLRAHSKVSRLFPPTPVLASLRREGPLLPLSDSGSFCAPFPPAVSPAPFLSCQRSPSHLQPPQLLHPEACLPSRRPLLEAEGCLSDGCYSLTRAPDTQRLRDPGRPCSGFWVQTKAGGVVLTDGVRSCFLHYTGSCGMRAASLRNTPLTWQS